MWPFKKKVQETYAEPVKELIVNKTLRHDYQIIVGIESCVTQTDRWRVFFIVRDNCRVLPRQGNLEKHRAMKVAYAWAKALEVTYDMSLEQELCDL